jgi:hypothetical protein
MSNTPKQNKNERFAKFLEDSFGKNSSSNDLRRINRNVEKKKREQFRRKPK